MLNTISYKKYTLFKNSLMADKNATVYNGTTILLYEVQQLRASLTITIYIYIQYRIHVAYVLLLSYTYILTLLSFGLNLT